MNWRLSGTIITLFIVTLFSVSIAHGNQTKKCNCVTHPTKKSLSAPIIHSPDVLSDSQIELTWQQVLAVNNHTISYVIYRGGQQVATTSDSTYTDSGLTPSTTYSYKVYAVDSGGDKGPFTETITATTQAAPVTKSNPLPPAPPPPPAPPKCFTAEQAWNEIGQIGCVTFIGYAYTSYSGQMYLNQNPSDYSSGFSVWIPSGENFGQSLLNQYSGKSIEVSGTISQYKGAPEIEITDPSQVQLAQ